MGSRLESKSNEVRKRIESHTFENEEGEEYEPSKFGGFGDYFRRKKIKLQNLDAELRSSSGENPPIFRGIVAHVNGYTTPSLNDIHRLIVSHGGGFLQYLDGKTMVTHIIASSLTPKKKVEFRKYRIVKPAWVVESVQAGRLLPWDDFRVVDEGAAQKVLGFDNGRVVSQTSNTQRGYREQTENSWYNSQFNTVADGSEASGQFKSNRQGRGDARGTQAASHIPATDLDEENGAQVSASFEEELLKMPLENIEPLRTSQVMESDGRLAADGDESPFLGDEEYDGRRTATSPRPNVEILQSLEKEKKDKSLKTAEEHNAELLSDPRMLKSSAINPDFLRQYYQESRLHHLSTWKAELKSQMQALAQEKTASQKGRHKRPSAARRYVLHVDFDCFFAAVSLRNRPDLTEKPVVVAHGSGPGSEIASCNYPARKFGVKNGMWMKSALQLCPDLKVLSYDFKAYEEASRSFYEAIIATDGVVQSVSIDEALVDISMACTSAGDSDGRGVSEGSIDREQSKANEIAQNLRDRIRERTGCAVSIGIGGNILLAKVALRKAKPAGQYQIKPEEVVEFLGVLTVQELPGVAYSIGGKLEEIGVKFVKDIRGLTKDRVITILGPKTGEKIWNYSRGLDNTEVGEVVVRKSVSAEVNWGIRFVTQEHAEEFVQSLCEELHRRLLENGVKGRQVTMKIMRRAADAPLDPPKHLGHGKCDTFNKSVVLGVATNSKEILGKEAISVLRGFGFSPGELRGLGVQMTKLEPIKPIKWNVVDSSQKRLQFNVPETGLKKLAGNVDPIEDIDSPQKRLQTSPTVVPAIGGSSNDEFEKRLNVLGTQFVVPTQVDPQVLAELPEDIRSKFAPTSRQEPVRGSPFDDKSRSQSPTAPQNSIAPPRLDPEALAALPDDVRAEVLAFYSNPANAPRDNRHLLPQSPRKLSISSRQPSRKPVTTPTKKKGSFLFKGKAPSKSSVNSTLTQSNFVAARRADDSIGGLPIGEDEISADFLAALPPDIRREVLDSQKRSRLKRKGGLDLGTRSKHQRLPDSNLSIGQKRLRLPLQSEKPTFTAKKLSSITDLRDAMTAWFDEFRQEGPYDEDIQALVKYLKRVVLEEKDMDKAVSVAKWIAWLMKQSGQSGLDGDNESGQKRSWAKALKRVQDGIQDAIKERGLGRVEFDIGL